MVARMRKKMYFCGVKTSKRHEVAARVQRFLCPNLLVKYSRIECASSNAHKVFALEYLTTRNATFLMSKL